MARLSELIDRVRAWLRCVFVRRTLRGAPSLPDADMEIVRAALRLGTPVVLDVHRRGAWRVLVGGEAVGLVPTSMAARLARDGAMVSKRVDDAARWIIRERTRFLREASGLPAPLAAPGGWWHITTHEAGTGRIPSRPFIRRSTGK